MFRRTILVVLALVAGLWIAPRAAPADMADALNQMPADVHVVVAVRNWQALGGKINAIAQKLGLADKLPPGGDLTAEIARETGLNLGQLDKTGSLILVVPKLSAEEGAEPKIAVLLPMKDYQAFKTENNVEVKDGHEVFSFEGETLFVSQLGRYACLGDDAEMAAVLAKPGPKLGAAMTPGQTALANACDVLVHANVQAVFAMARPVIEKELRVPGGQDAVRSFIQMLDAVGRDSEALDAGLVLADDGIELRGLLTAKNGSAMGQAFTTAAKPAAPLISGVPLGNYLLAAGLANGLSPDSDFAKRWAEMSVKGTAGATGDVEQAARMGELGQKLARLVKRQSLSITAAGTAEKPTLPIALTVVAEVTDVAAARQAARDYLTEWGKVLSAQLPPPPPPAGAGPAGQPAAAAGPPITLTPDAETVAGVKVDKWVLDPKALGPTLGPMAQMLPRFLGDTELALRLGARGNTLVWTVGGGQAGFQAALKAVDAKTSLNADPGVGKVKGHLADNPSGVIYIATDRIVGMALDVVGGMMGQALPPFPKVPEPITLSYGFKDRAVHGRFFVPMSLIVGGKRYIDEVSKPTAAQPGPGPAPMPPPDF